MPPTTKISLTSLSLPHPLLAPSIWAPPKPQPALLTTVLTLRGAGFTSAAASDTLDASTIHYGILAKNIRGRVVEGMDLKGVFGVVEGVIREMGGAVVESWRVEVGLQKASCFGEGVVVSRDGEGRWGFEVKGVKVMVLVGVNGYEREGRQPVLVDFGVRGKGEVGESVLFGLEGRVVELMERTSFETLETLIEYLFSELRKSTLDENLPGAEFHLRIAKPRAIAFADAPVVEIVREIPRKPSTTAAAPDVLCILKPYDR